jgi:hypothetical protein
VSNGEPPSSLTRTVSPAVEGLTATLEDVVRELPGERITWSTSWVLRWEPYPGAIAYELQALTGEGVSPKLRRQGEHCFRLEVAANENERWQGLLHRDLQLVLRVGQLAYRVRAVLDANSVSAWSPMIAVGAVSRLDAMAQRLD